MSFWKKNKLAVSLIFLIFSVSCSVGNQIKLPPKSEIFITTGDIDEDYIPLGLVSGVSRGVQLVFPIGFSIDEALELMLNEARKLEAEAVINVEFEIAHSQGCLWVVPTACVKGMAIKFE